MTDHPADLRALWDDVVQELIERSHDSDSGLGPLTHQQRAYLKITHPVMIAQGFVVLSTPHTFAKHVVEDDLGPHLTALLSAKLNTPCSLAVSIDPNAGGDDLFSQAPAHVTAPPTAPTPTPAGASPTASPNAPQNLPSRSAGSTPAPPQAKSAQPVPPEAPSVTRVATAATTSPQVESPQSARDLDAPSGNRLPRETPAAAPKRSNSLNPKYTFESFVIGHSNRFANSAAVAVAESPAKAYNPLFIWGGSGLGKTHLLHAAGNYARELHPALKIKYVSSEEFTNDYINSVRDDRQESFKRRYRDLDILMVDDIQFLQGKEGTQEEFFHTFNALHQAEKQIILSSDRPPKQLTTLEDRLRTRFEGGLITDIQPPDLETRIAILMRKAEADGTHVDRDVLELIASCVQSSIRELEGALIRVSAFASLNGQTINREIAEMALRDVLPDAADIEITASTIMEVTAEYFDISMDTLCGTSKTRAVAHPRQLAMYLCRELTELSLPKIGEHFGGKDHSTVIYAVRKIREEMNEKHDTYDEIQELTHRIKHRGRL